MSYLAEFRGWEPLTLADLLMAYHKGKADCYFENTFRVPAKESFERVLACLRCGKNDFYVMGLDIEKLRAFQSRAKRWTEIGDPSNQRQKDSRFL